MEEKQKKQSGEKNDDTQKTREKSSEATIKVKEETTNKANQEASVAEEMRIESYDFSAINPELVEKVKESLQHMLWLDEELADMKFVLATNIREFPFVQFTHGRERVIRPQPFTKTFRGVGTATRWQIPLTLA